MGHFSRIHSYDGFCAAIRNGSASTSSLVLDSDRGELVEAPFNLDTKGVSAERSAAALKNHSDAERRRRARINAHLGSLRSLVPGGKKMDKATLLAEVISHLKVLKRAAAEVSDVHIIPKEIDEITVEQQEDGLEGVPYSIRASLCCDYKPGLLPDLRQALHALDLIIKRAEIATLNGRMKNVFVLTSCKGGDIETTELRRFLETSVHQAIKSVLNKFSDPQEFSFMTFPNKRRRITMFNSSSSSSIGDFCFSR
ncbi:transcription factor bHLH30-like [Cucurbita pepo subsp. pepo]|uniref:transcription factor bHLH30-like n=1 Tax=Cucurbita pepo subsp. pepo TaxID=3664 RepID=UPI000C9D4CE4|nr:transcription factor bHLH30-like [Cucurbita pepo subsp. pepo]